MAAAWPSAISTTRTDFSFPPYAQRRWPFSGAVSFSALRIPGEPPAESAGNDCAITVVGVPQPRRLAGVADGLARRIAADLRRPLAAGAIVEIHDDVGTPFTRGRRVHLFRTASRHIDLRQLPHELVHVVAGLSPQRFLSEGLAVEVASRLSPGRAWPTFWLTPDEWLACLHSRDVDPPPPSELLGVFATLRLEQIAADGSSSIVQAATAYIVAGSFVHFRLQSLERAVFWRGYDAGSLWESPDHLCALESAWRKALPHALDSDGRTRLARSLDESRRQMDGALRRR